MLSFRTFQLIVAILFFVSQPGYCTETETTHQIDPAFLKQLQNNSSYTIAILPMENLSVDSDVAYHFRQRITERLRAKGYTVVNNESINKQLYALGVAHAGQLGLLPFEELRKITSADGFLSGVVEQSATQHAGIYNGYVYMCSVKLQNRDGKVVWASLQNRVAKRRFAIDPINALLDIALTEGGGGDSREAVYALADQMLASLPKGPVQVVLGDPLLDMAIEIPTQQK
jgi:hypothetical protein